MKLYNIETGEEWDGEPIDAREMLARGGWSESKAAADSDPEPEAIEEVAPVKRGRKRA